MQAQPFHGSLLKDCFPQLSAAGPYQLKSPNTETKLPSMAVTKGPKDAVCPLIRVPPCPHEKLHPPLPPFPFQYVNW